MKRRLWLSATAITPLLFGLDHPIPNSMHTIPVTLSFDVEEGSLHAQITVKNPDSTPLYLEKSKFGAMAGVFLNTFKIRTSTEPIAFIGALPKLPAPEPSDFIEVQPNAEVTTPLKNLEKYYRLIPGSKTYFISYRSLVVPPGSSSLYEFKSPEVEVTFTL